MDLSLRGSGELGGGPSASSGSARQWGISDLGMGAIKNIKMVEAAREEARRLLEEDLALLRYPLLAERLSSQKTPTHFE